ncbi:MAG: hypothetical protein DHS20C20_07690 [Ardenticatenaceae bacterium]|nr:MAG: hypothetical protein DHS20C20_07690 [Ardenticatenaceae bacterium]
MNSKFSLPGTVKQTSPFIHFVLTRFNVRTEFNAGILPRDSWLKNRFELFDRFAYPSMYNQVCKNFLWLVFLDKKTPESYRQEMTGYAKALPNMTPLYVDHIKVGTPEIMDVIRPFIAPHITPQTPYLISTRFDNDDAVSQDFISIIQQQFKNQTREFINLPNGYLWQNNKLYTKRDESNPFISLIEEATDFETVWCVGHHLAKARSSICQVETTPQWIQVIHGQNVSNRVRVGNIRLPLKTLPGTFHLAMQSHALQESAWQINAENQIKKRIRRFRWKWKQFKERILTN